MILLVAGLCLFIGIHLIPIYGLHTRSILITRFGKRGYSALFAIAVLGSLAVLIMGWRASDPGFLYAPPGWGYHVTPLFVAVAFVLFTASNAPSNIRRLVRHPQMTGVFLWGIGHLFANGELRSVILFGGLSLWAVITIIGSNARDGDWIKRTKEPIIKDLITVILALGLYVGFIAVHEWLIGVSPLPLAA